MAASNRGPFVAWILKNSRAHDMCDELAVYAMLGERKVHLHVTFIYKGVDSNGAEVHTFGLVKTGRLPTGTFGASAMIHDWIDVTSVK